MHRGLGSYTYILFVGYYLATEVFISKLLGRDLYRGGEPQDPPHWRSPLKIILIYSRV